MAPAPIGRTDWDWLNVPPRCGPPALLPDCRGSIRLGRLCPETLPVSRPPAYYNPVSDACTTPPAVPPPYPTDNGSVMIITDVIV